jgi:hypothetical protein
MKKSFTSCAVALGLFAGATPAFAVDTDVQGKVVSTLYTHATSPCVFFQLEGVPEANAGFAGSPWFAIEKTNKESYSVLLTARLTGMPLKRVYSDGVAVCGSTRAMVIEL